MGETWLRMVGIAAGGAFGAVARHSLNAACVSLLGERFGHGTLVANVLGCFLLGLLMHEAWLPSDRAPHPLHSAATVGLLGGFTTFSTFGYQTIRHVEQGDTFLAVANVALNLSLGLVAAAIGISLARTWWPT